MKRLALLLLLLASPAFAQRGNIYSTKAQEEFSKALTEGVLFGVPRYTTVALPICDATQVGALAWNTTTNTLWGCNGTAWAAVDAGGGGGSVTPGSTPFGSCTNQFVIADAGSFLNCDAGLTYNAVTNAANFPGVATFAAGANVSNGQTWGLGNVVGLGGLGSRTESTPDAAVLFTGSTGNSLHVFEVGDASFDFNNGPCLLAACTDPTFIIHSHNQTTTEYLAFRHDGANGVISVGAGAVAFPTQTNISGPDANTNVEIGAIANSANAGTGGTNTAIGSGATNSGSGANNTVVGAGANTAGGSGTLSSAFGVGAAAATSGSGLATALGANASASASGTAIGTGSVAGVNQFVAGASSPPMNNVYFGKGVTNATATAYTINGTGGTGANNAGAALQLAGGLGTGTAAGGDVRLQRSPSIATGSTAQTVADAMLIRSQMKALTAATPTAFVRVNLAAGTAGITGWTGGTVFYTLVSNDGTDFQSASGSVPFSAVNVGSAEVCSIEGADSSEQQAVSTGSMSVSFSTDVAGVTNGCDLRANATSTLTETTLALFYSVVMNGPGTLTPQ